MSVIYSIVSPSFPVNINSVATFLIYVTGGSVPGGLVITVTSSSSALVLAPANVSGFPSGVSEFTATSSIGGNYSLSFSNNASLVDISPISITIGAGGNYCSQSDIEDIFGVYNIAVWSSKDPTVPQGTATIATVQAAINFAQGRIIDYFRDYGNYVFPLVPQGEAAYIVRDWCAKLAGVWLYQNRGTRDTPEDHKYVQIQMAVLEDMAMHVSTRKLNAPRRWPTSTAPVGV